MNSKYHGLIGKVWTNPKSIITICLESNDVDTSSVVDVIFDSQSLGKVIFDSNCQVTVSYEIDDSKTSVNSCLQFTLPGKDQSLEVHLKSMLINEIDVTHLVSTRVIEKNVPAVLNLDKPLWAWMVRNWTKILPNSHKIWQQLRAPQPQNIQ